MISMDLSCDDPKTFARNSSISSASSVNTEGNHIVRTSDVQLSKPLVKPESVVVRKFLRHAVYEGREDPPRRVSRYLVG
ncbi:hypothetical protein KIN20_008068 [Parelaphostrongylus tenuis]|uniref:Uncharacterized protein n=1 Tax=Parelaphostrongylus tenuis TaxID=148309 RepID=A0AAD5M488_PARTN|nr:hypothetical protein KIN20_008068 [Parelaphostrongylus tenuis]